MGAIGVAACLSPHTAAAQAFGDVGTRAAGMGGAFVGIADDASAIYWNPGGLAAGSYFSLVVDRGTGEVVPDGSLSGGDSSSFLLGLAMPALGISYYRLHSARVVPPPVLVPVDGDSSSRNLSAAAALRVDTLVTHQGGFTFVQSLYPGVSVGTTVKLVRGIAASSAVVAETAADALDSEAAEMLGKPTNRVDLDIGVMAAGGPLKAGLTVRNVREPHFEAAGLGGDLTLERQARAGVSYAVSTNWIAAADFDLLRTHDAFGARRDIAVGVEGRLGARAVVRSGLAVNTVAASGAGDARRAVSVGGSYAARASIYVDGHFTAGNDRAGRQWGVAARFVY